MRSAAFILSAIALTLSCGAKATVSAQAGCGAWASFATSSGGGDCPQLIVEHNTTVTTDYGMSDANGLAMASSSYAVRAAYGDLGGRVAASAALSFSPDAPGGYPFGHAWVWLAFSDQVAVTSATLAVGTPVSLLFRGIVEVEAPEKYGAYVDSRFAIGSSSDGHEERYCYGDFMPDCADRSWLGLTTFSQVINAYVGDTLTLFGMLNASVDVSIFGDEDAGSVSEDLLIDAFNGARTYLDAMTDGFSLMAASGHDYRYVASEVPAPPVIACLMVGLAAMFLRGRTEGRPVSPRLLRS